MDSTLEMLNAFAVELKGESLDARRSRIEEVEREMQEIELLAVPATTARQPKLEDLSADSDNR